ncbi:hypothetical protein N9419_04920 [Candidatus Pelagibacter sp.]|nr:hypothetical protein [Candidatus Pelagibacter sp.]
MKLLIISISFVLIIFPLKAQEKYTINDLLSKNYEIKQNYFVEGVMYMILENARHEYFKTDDGKYERKKQIIYYCKTTINESICIKP